MLFTGHYEHSIDAKGRLAIPAEIRSLWSLERDGHAWFAVPWIGRIIRLYTETGFRTRATSYSSDLTPDEDIAELNTTLFGLTRRLELDASGRVRLPDELLELAGLHSTVVLIGAGDWLEVRDRDEWKRSIPTRLQQLPELMKRVEMKRRSQRGGMGADTPSGGE
ncbi:MAG: division/cell wall cluster transcriptional repressor MraZ [Phycisphaerales bacterium JB043]